MLFTLKPVDVFGKIGHLAPTLDAGDDLHEGDRHGGSDLATRLNNALTEAAVLPDPDIVSNPALLPFV